MQAVDTHMVASSFPLINSYQLVLGAEAGSYRAPMNIRAIRVENLKLLVREFESIAEVARRGETSEKYLWQIIKGVVQRNNPRSVGDALAARLEHGCDKPAGWMDQNHEVQYAKRFESDSAPLIAREAEAAFSEQALSVARYWDSLPQALRDEMVARIEFEVASRQFREKSTKPEQNNPK